VANSFVTAGGAHAPASLQEKERMAYQHQEWPKWMYKAGPDGVPVSQIFDKDADVPKGEGWVDHPDKAVKPKLKPFQKKSPAADTPPVEDESA
jgi:hypothetical protein